MPTEVAALDLGKRALLGYCELIQDK